MKRNNRKLLLWVAGITSYVLALILLTVVESHDPDSSIRTFGDAVWYSFVTMSTVGYGDMYPVTPLGKVLGIGFVLLSLGLLTFVINLMIRLISGKVLPAVKLWWLRKRPWFLFSCANEPSRVLASDLQKQYPKGVFLFAGEEAPEGCLVCPGSMETLVTRKKADCSLFYMNGEYESALDALNLGHPVYCLTEIIPETIPEGLTLFDRYDCCARHYWQHHGLKKREKTVLIIGNGRYAESLLTRALLLNIFEDGRHICYHVFGDWENYRRNHYLLKQTVLLNAKKAGSDSLYFHSAWNEDPTLLAEADRIILCEEETRENLKSLSQLRAYFPVMAAVHLRSQMHIPGETVFGLSEQMFTAELVMRQQLTATAKTMHEIYRRSTGGNAPKWEQLPGFLQQSNIAAADHLLTKLQLLLEDDGIHNLTAENCAEGYARYLQTREERQDCYRRMEHDRWMRFHSFYNWNYGDVRDNAARLHPMMCPFEALSPEEQAKDDYAWELLNDLAENL